MNRYTLIYLLFFIVACENKDKATQKTTQDSASQKTRDTLFQLPIDQVANWVDDLNRLKTAILANDSIVIKSYFQFPVNNTNNEIWYLLLTDKEMKEKAIADAMVPFMAEDFDKYYSKIFSKQMKTCLAAIKTDSLLAKGEAASKVFTDKDETECQLLISKDSEMGIVSLLLNERAGEGDYAMETSTIYIFTILNDKTIRFKEIRMAG
jgi:hypothetical protein